MEEDFETTEESIGNEELISETSEVSSDAEDGGENSEREDKTPVWAFDEDVHPAGDKKAHRVQLTKEDLDPRNDLKLKVLFDFIDDPEMDKYFQMPSLRGLRNYFKSVEVSLKTDFANYKKRERI